MNWSSCIPIFARRGWISLFTIVAAVIFAFVQSTTQKPVYRAVQRVSLQPPQPATAQSARFTAYSPEPYTSWLGSLEHASQVVSALELDMAPHELQATVSIEVDSEKALLGITVEMEDAVAAVLIAKTYGTNFIRWLNDQNQSRPDGERVSATLSDYPHLATKGTFTAELAALYALIGALVGISAIYGRIVFDRLVGSFKNPGRVPCERVP